MTTRFKTSLAAGFVAIAMAGAVPGIDGTGRTAAAARRPGRRPADARTGRSRTRVPGLDLTDDQQAQLRKIREARQSEFKAAGEKLGAARQGMRALIEADTINESAIRAKSAEVAAAEAEVAILNAKVRAESLQILTSEQQAKLKELRASRAGTDEAAPRPARSVGLDGLGAWLRGPTPSLQRSPELHRHSSPPVLPFIVPSIRARRSLPSFQ